MLARHLRFFALACLLGCSSKPAPEVRQPDRVTATVAAHPVVSATSLPAPDAPKLHERTYPEEQRVDVASWMKAHGIIGQKPTGDCWDLKDRVGVPPAPGLLCETTFEAICRRTARVFRVRGHDLQSVWSATADFGHREHPFRRIVITRFAHRDQGEGTRGVSSSVVVHRLVSTTRAPFQIDFVRVVH